MYLLFHNSVPTSLRPYVSRKVDTTRNPEAYIVPTSARNQYGMVRDRSGPVLGRVGASIGIHSSGKSLAAPILKIRSAAEFVLGKKILWSSVGLILRQSVRHPQRSNSICRGTASSGLASCGNRQAWGDEN